MVFSPLRCENAMFLRGKGIQYTANMNEIIYILTNEAGLGTRGLYKFLY